MRRAVIALLAFTTVSIVQVSGTSPPDLLAGRLATLGRVWLAVKFVHPRVALAENNWDEVLDTALPAVKASADDKAFAGAVQAMLATIEDPVTRVVFTDSALEPAAGGPGPAPAVPPKIGPLTSGALLIDVRAPGALADAAVMRKAIAENIDAINRADRLVVDARGTSRAGFSGEQMFAMLNDVLVSAPTALPTTRYVRHSGYRAQAGGAAFYGSELVTAAALVQQPRAGIGPRRVAFVLDSTSLVPPVALALQAAGQAVLVFAGEPPLGRGLSVPLFKGATAAIRERDTVIDGRRVERRADVTVLPTDTDAQVHAAAAQAIASARAPSRGIVDPAPAWQPEAAYAAEPYPTEARRLLAVYRLWGVFNNFFPYKHLMDKPWDDALAAFIPRALAATTELEYAQVMAEMAALSGDSHVGVSGSRAFSQFMGEVPPPILVQYVEGKPIVTRVLDTAAAPGAAAGDEIVSVDGEAAPARAARLARYISYSTPAGRDRAIASGLLGGERGSVAKVVLRDAAGASREVQITRTPPAGPRAHRDGEVTRILDGNIGYADLERLQVQDVPAMFERFKNTAGIIFDMRGYPRGTAWAIAPRINTRRPAFAALFQRPLMSAGATEERLTFMQPLPPTTTWVYDKRTVMLIDERAISQSEHTGLFLKAANGTTFVGSPTTGANGDVTSLVLPGGLRVNFTGHDVRWPDGRQLQRVGLVPDVKAVPTIAGIRAGQDEVLEKGMEVLGWKRGS